eukprot:gnl/MRDRNA2_/MRDRNA2_91539_c0_seq1.p1 gnl/MRDRNA2_/MRDRNA2_91539_c0~~gnl/MRDRNA2_/MRDRNA2_91539_c0_seq1.p1  ORF type:complete len:743 (-),score=154.81 gnl/MRDRNA2_/MRDRNA2_91539_c0_seq1:386-2614(-)
MTFSVPSALLFPDEMVLWRPKQSKYREVLSAGLKKCGGQRSASCTKLPPVHSSSPQTGSPGLSYTTSSHKFSSWPCPEKKEDRMSSLPSMHRSKRSLSSGRTAAPDFFPKLPNLLTDKLFVAANESQKSRMDNRFVKNGHQKREVHSQHGDSHLGRLEQKPQNGRRVPVAASTKSKGAKTQHQPGAMIQHQVGNASHTTSASALEQHSAKFDSQKENSKSDAVSLNHEVFANHKGKTESCDKDITIADHITSLNRFADESLKLIEQSQDSENQFLSSTADCGHDTVKICANQLIEIFEWPDSPDGEPKSEQHLDQMNCFGDIVYRQKSTAGTGYSVITRPTTQEVSRPASAMSQGLQAELTVLDELDRSDPLANKNEGASNELPIVSTNKSSVLDEKEMTIAEAVLSPVRLAKRKSRSISRDFSRGQTVGLKGELDPKCLPEEQLQGLKSTFTKYDEDHNGWLSVLEFGKFLQDQGMEVDVSEVKEAVAMVAPNGHGSVDLDSFTQLVAHGLQAQALREEQTCGYSKEEAEALRKVFDSYDVNHTGVLEASEIGTMLQDMGQAPRSHEEQEELRNVLQGITGGSLRPLRFREFLELAKILETTTIGSGGNGAQEHGLKHRKSSDRLEIARKVGLTMADLTQLQGIFEDESKNGSTLGSMDLYELLKTRLRLHAAEGEREQRVHFAIQKYASTAGSVDFEDFLLILGDLVDAKLATVSELLGRRVGEERSTNSFLGHMAVLLE